MPLISENTSPGCSGRIEVLEATGKWRWRLVNANPTSEGQQPPWNKKTDPAFLEFSWA